MCPKTYARAVLAVALLASLPVCQGRCGSSVDSTPQPLMIGRFAPDPDHPGASLFAWSHSTITTRFTGTGVAIRLEDVVPKDGPNLYNVIIDDQPPVVLTMREGQSKYPLAMGLPPTEHTVTVVKRTEALVGTARFAGFEFDPGGRALQPPKPPERRLLIIGDSISAGYGNEGADQNCPFTGATENSALAYGPLAAKALGAQVQVIAWSGKGVYQNRDTSKTETIPDLQDRILPMDANSRWNPNDYIPHVIVVDLGTNDFGHDVAPEQPFENAYDHLVTKLRATYPDAYIVMALGPMLADTEQNHHQLSVARHDMQAVLTRLNAEHVQKVAMLEFPPQDGKLGFGCDWHPSRATHAQMAAQLAASLAHYEGWPPATGN